jgi:hypothetical protein
MTKKARQVDVQVNREKKKKDLSSSNLPWTVFGWAAIICEPEAYWAYAMELSPKLNSNCRSNQIYGT